jgi:capsular polysaccharide biosynthesis protein
MIIKKMGNRVAYRVISVKTLWLFVIKPKQQNTTKILISPPKEDMSKFCSGRIKFII